MNDFIFIFFTIAITTALIYFLYSLMLGSDRTKEADLQITSKELLEQITILHKQKKYNIVENLAKNYLEKKPGDDGVRAILAKALFEVRKIYDAVEHSKIILKHKPNDYENQIFLANCYVQIEKPMKAINILQELLERDSNNVVAIKELAGLYDATNQKQSAIRMYKKLDEFLESNQERAKNKIKIAELHVLFLEYDLAIKEYESILEIYPEDISVRKRLIELYKAQSDYDSAIDLANEMYLANKDDAIGLWAMKELMSIYRIMADYDKALEFANLIKENALTDQIQVGEDIAKILLEKGQIDASIDMLKQLVEQDSQNIKLKKTLAVSYEANNDFEEAIALYKKILDGSNANEISALHYEMSGIYANWAMYMYSQKDNAECFKLFTTALKYCATNPDIYFRLGNVNMAIKNYNESISQYKKAIELDPEIFDYYYALAQSYEEIGSVYEQKKVLLESLKYNQSNAKVYYKLGEIFESQNDIANATSNLKKAIELDDMFVEPKRKLALILEHKGNKEDAIILYEEILKIEPENEEIANNLKMLKG